MLGLNEDTVIKVARDEFKRLRHELIEESKGQIEKIIPIGFRVTVHTIEDEISINGYRRRRYLGDALYTQELPLSFSLPSLVKHLNKECAEHNAAKFNLDEPR